MTNKKVLRPFKRKYLIDRSSQMAMVAYGLLNSMLAAIAGMSFQHLLFVNSFENTNRFSWISIAAVAVVFMLVFMFSSYFLGIFLSNRIAGPIFRLRKHTQEMIESKKVIEVKTRKDDYFKDFEDTYNQFLTQVEFRRGSK